MSDNPFREIDEAETAAFAASRLETPGEAVRRSRRHERLSQAELGKLYIEKETSSPGYKAAAPLILAVIAVFCKIAERPASFLSPQIHVSQASATYTAAGKVDTVSITCADSSGVTLPCSDDITASETRCFQSSHDFQLRHDKAIADAKRAADKKRAAKKKL